MKPINIIAHLIQYLIFLFWTSRKSQYSSLPNLLLVGRRNRPTCSRSSFCLLSIDVFLEVQDKTYCETLYLIAYIVYGLHLWYSISVFNEICRSAICQHPGLATSLHCLRFADSSLYVPEGDLIPPETCSRVWGR